MPDRQCCLGGVHLHCLSSVVDRNELRVVRGVFFSPRIRFCSELSSARAGTLGKPRLEEAAMNEHYPVGSVQPKMGAFFWVATSALVAAALILLMQALL